MEDKLSQTNYFYKLCMMWNVFLSCFALMIGIIVSACIHQWNITYAFAIGLFFPPLGVLIGKLVFSIIFEIIKNTKNKGFIMFIAIVLYLLKYIVICLPLIIGSVVNIVTKQQIFNPYALAIVVFIYPLTTIIVQFYYVKRNKKKIV